MTHENDVIVIAPDKQPEQIDWAERQIRVAAYCRVSTDDAEQLTSFEAQKDYYTAKIMESRQWIMAGIFADEGISATSAKKRPAFQKMLRKCKDGKIDLILTKSVSRFARNTLDCITTIRNLKALGVAVYFEKENINTMEEDSEFVLTILGSLAQAESESMSRNIKWGKRRAMQSGKVSFQCGRIYGYECGENGQPKIIPEQAKVICRIFNWYLSGTSVADIVARLNDEQVLTSTGKAHWTDTAVRGILRNEKYCGDVLQQKTFVADVLTKRIVKNNGQLPKYLIKNYHAPTISREIFYKTQAEMAKRMPKKTEHSTSGRQFQRYSGKYGLNDIMLCAECGSVFKRAVWTKRNGEKQPVWRCLNRLENGKQYCKSSSTIKEKELQVALLDAIRAVYQPEAWQTDDHLPTQLVSREWSHEDSREIKKLKRSLLDLLTDENADTAMFSVEQEIVRLQSFSASISSTEKTTNELQPLEWDETLIRNLVSKVIVQANRKVMVRFKNGKQVMLSVAN